MNWRWTGAPKKRLKAATAELAHVSSWAENASAALDAALLAAGGAARRTPVPLRPFERGPPPAKTARKRKGSQPQWTQGYAAENDAKRLAAGLGQLKPLQTSTEDSRSATETAAKNTRRGTSAPVAASQAGSATTVTQSHSTKPRRSGRARNAAAGDDDDKAGSDNDVLGSSAQNKRHAPAAASSAAGKAPGPTAAPHKARASATALVSEYSAPMATVSPSVASSAARSAPIPVASAAALPPGASVPSAATTSPLAVLPSTPGGVHEWLAPLNSAGPACDVSIDAFETN